jgi:hypothetical protein
MQFHHAECMVGASRHRSAKCMASCGIFLPPLSLITGSLPQVVPWQAIDLKQNQDKRIHQPVIDRDLRAYPPSCCQPQARQSGRPEIIKIGFPSKRGSGRDVIKQLWPSASYAVVQGLLAGCRWSHVALTIRPPKLLAPPVSHLMMHHL